MKKQMKVELKSLIGDRVLFMCLNYFYAGKLVAVGQEVARLDDAAIVYETGEWSASSWKDAQPTGRPVYVRLAAIESYMPEKG